ncbi:putative disease resistance protein [Senna tora]|uniref:Putative disease resistance protein n=1 Tax=Senna tora TaxID=362788 RepID=A0A834T5F3_9FABA|nr:putative disease resistance protein [Senna tora]
MIGLYGIGGSGKTTLAKEVGKKVEELKLFDKVVMAVVSQPPNVRDIQGQIADQIGLKLKEETEFGRAQRLATRFQNDKIFIILDDVWGNLNLEDIGIPLNKDCVVLLTTRLRRVCVSMDCQSIIELPLLNQEEAWVLFKLRANITDDSPIELRDVAAKIVDECKGLPIAIVTVGSTLKGRSFVEWELALSKLQQSQPIDIEEGLRSPYACLKLSYDNLRNLVAKSIFLMCSIFPEDHNINEEDLIRFGKGMLDDLGEKFETMEDARREINAAINILLDSCLLMPTNKPACVKMHDLVRDVALWITKKEGQEFMVSSQKVPRMLMENETQIDTKIISLWNMGKNFKLSNQLHCPSLKVLLLHSKNSSEEPNVHLGGMKALKVLAFIRFSFGLYNNWHAPWSMPQSFESLTNLHTLCIRGKKLGDISFLGCLKGLEILDLMGSSFDELPIGIVDMKKLKLLDVFKCLIGKSPHEVIGKCIQVQELYLSTNNSIFEESVSLPRLQRYHIIAPMNDVSDVEPQRFGASKVLCIGGANVSALSLSMKDVFCRADILCLQYCIGGNTNFPSNANYLWLKECKEIKLLVDNMIEANANIGDSSINCSFQKLVKLHISHCFQLQKLHFSKSSSMHNLKTLTLSFCEGLCTTLFTPSIAQTLVSLEELNIIECRNLRHILAEEEEDGNEDNNYSDHGPLLLAFQNLRTFEVIHCHQLESTLPVSLAANLIRLESLIVKFCSNLKYVFGGGKADNKSIDIDIKMPALQIFLLLNVPSLIGLCPTILEKNIVWTVCITNLNQLCNQRPPQPLQTFLNLTKFAISIGGQRLQGIFELQVGGMFDCNNSLKDEEPLKLNSNLSELSLWQLRGLEFIWKGPTQILSLQSLKEIVLRECSKLKTIFTSTIVTSLPELRSLRADYCYELEGITSADWLTNISVANSNYNVCFPKLKSIDIWGCNKLKFLFSYSLASHCPSLQTLGIFSCSELERVVDGFEGKAGDDEARNGGSGSEISEPESIDEVQLLCMSIQFLMVQQLSHHSQQARP